MGVRIQFVNGGLTPSARTLLENRPQVKREAWEHGVERRGLGWLPNLRVPIRRIDLNRAALRVDQHRQPGTVRQVGPHLCPQIIERAMMGPLPVSRDLIGLSLSGNPQVRRDRKLEGITSLQPC